ncbi:MAG: hypothetical protein JWR63_3254, partial [Conexibacter sp.]|nr:hypothetical protein [Conexibacter sp.]
MLVPDDGAVLLAAVVEVEVDGAAGVDVVVGATGPTPGVAALPEPEPEPPAGAL